MTQDTPAALSVEMHAALCPAHTGGNCTCEKFDPAVDKAWAQFCAGIGDGPNAPYPGMIAAFERYYSQSFADKAWRSEAATWAAAWKASQAATSAAGGAIPTDAMIEAGKKILHASNGRGAREKVERIYRAMSGAALAAQSPAVPRGPINFTKEWCLQAAEAEEAGNACWDAGALTQAADAGAAEPVARVIFTGRKKPDVEWLTDEVRRDTLLYTGPPAQQLQQAVARAKDDAADLCDQLARDWWEVRKATSNTNTRHHLHSKVHGAEQCAAAIRQQGTP